MMEKLEKFYKGKFEGHQEKPMPDAFDRIMKGLEKESMQGNGADHGTIISKSYASLLKISLSLNILLLAAIPLLYYLLSDNAETTIVSEMPQKTNPANETQYVKANDPELEKSAWRSVSQKKNLKQDHVIIEMPQKEDNKYTSEVQQKPVDQQVLMITEESKRSSEIKVQEQNSPSPKKEELNAEPKKKKRNTDLYYEENASRLKDSANFLFKKEK